MSVRKMFVVELLSPIDKVLSHKGNWKEATVCVGEQENKLIGSWPVGGPTPSLSIQETWALQRARTLTINQKLSSSNTGGKQQWRI